MSHFSSFTGRFPVHKNGVSSNKVTKRPRQSLVCSQCRISKLRCDKGHPCSSCIKRDEPEICNYQNINGECKDSSSRLHADDKLAHLELLVKELMQSQRLIQAPDERISSTPKPILNTPLHSSMNRDQNQDSEHSGMIYVGLTHWSAIMDDIQGLKAALSTNLEEPESEELVEPEILDIGRELIFGSPNNYSLQQIISQHLPSRVEVDRFLSIYFQGESFIIPFIHVFHFQKQYREFWDDTSKVNPLWLSILFSICHMASLAVGATGYQRFPSHSPVAKLSTFQVAAGQCLVLGGYHRPQKFTVEALVLYAHCKSMSKLDPSREAGAILSLVVRMSYEMGYHRDPDSLKCFTPFEGEMRRRFWAVCKQYDLMLSFQRGLPSNVRFENCDTKSPGNLLDSDFDANTNRLPDSRPETEATQILWFIVKERLMPGFCKVCQVALSFEERSEAEVAELDREIRRVHSAVPDVLRVRPFSESIADPPLLIMTRIYVEFIHLKSLCVLHRRYMARGVEFSTRSCTDAGIQLVSHFIDCYNELSPGGQLYGDSWLINHFILSDFLLGLMVLCLVVHTGRGKPANSTVGDYREKEVIVILEQAHAICVERLAASKDAHRVSRAIHLTLNGTPSSAMFSDGTRQPFHPTASSLANTNGQQNLSSPLQSDFAQFDDTSFGSLDPFNFLNIDMGNVDFSMFEFEPENWGQNTRNVEDIMPR